MGSLNLTDIIRDTEILCFCRPGRWIPFDFPTTLRCSGCGQLTVGIAGDNTYVQIVLASEEMG